MRWECWPSVAPADFRAPEPELRVWGAILELAVREAKAGDSAARQWLTSPAGVAHVAEALDVSPGRLAAMAAATLTPRPRARRRHSGYLRRCA